MLKTRQIDYLIMRKKRKLSVTENETVKLKQKYFDPHYYNLCKLDKVGGESQEDDVVLNDEYGHFGINLNNKKKEIMNIHSQNICLICRQMECVNNECCPTTMEVITKINKHRQNINNIINNISSYKYNDNEKTYNNNMNTNVDDGNKKLCCQCSNSTIKCNKSLSKKKNFHHNRKLHSAYTSHFNELTTLIRSPPLLLPLKISEPLLQKQKPQQPFTLSTLPLQEQPLSLMNKRQITMPTFSMISHSIFDYNELNRFYRFSSRVCNSIRNCISKSTQRTFHKLSIIYLMLMSLIASLSLAKFRFKINTQNLPIVFILVNFIVSIVLCPCVQASFQSHSLSLPTNEIIRSSSSGNIGGLSTDLSTEQVRLQNPGHVCTSKDIRNDPIELRALENCTVIEGFLLLVLMEKANHTEFENWSFPKLTEITEFLFIYRVSGLRTLAQLFPNLSVIRGNEHFNGFGLAVYENNHLEEIGLKSLTTIKGGGVRIEKNPSLCFVNTVDWKMMTSVPPNLIHLTLNKPPMECPQCPDKSEWCWNSKTPQKMCPKQCSDNCNDKFECCHSSCVGGCAIDNPRLCTSCRYLEYNGSCVRKCPPNHFEYIGRSCITAEECIQNKATKYNFGKRETLVPFNGTCSVRCPPSYNKVNGTCVPCEEGKCIVKCPGGQIETLSESRRLDGCTHIIELPLIISVKQTGPHVMHELETAMSSIETIDCYLKIVATHGVVSLSFLKNLKHIKGEILEDKKFALYVLENNSLERLFSPGQNLLIERGRLFFHFNPKLCFKEINELRSSLGENKDKELDYNDVARDSNGSKGSCHKETLNVIVTMTSPTVALVNISNPMVFDDSRKFIGYQFYYMVDPYRNATMYSDNSCDSGWKSNGEAVKSLPYVFTNLQPYTQYAFYVKTYTISSENRSGQSDIHYFRTKPTTPSKVTNVNAKKQNGSEVLIQWEPPNVVNGNLTAYVITVNISDSNNLSKDKNYCKEPSKGAVDLIPPKPLQPSKETSLSPADCNCEVVPGKEKIDESDRQDEIDFENSIHNYIYIKHIKKNDTSGSLATNRRRRRDTSQILLSSIGEKNYSRPEDRPNNAILKEEPDLRNIGRLLFIENDQNGRYIERISKIVNSSITSIVIGGLKHFTDYMVYVSACRATEQDEIVNSDPSKWTNCSLDARTFVRTEKLDNVDIVRNVQLELENTNNTRSNVRVKWDPPDNPNGMIVAYTIKYKSDSTDAEAEKRCITEWDYQNLTTGYPLSGLQSGNYSVEVRANSLAGEGKFSEPQYIYVPSPGISNLIIAVIVIVLLALISTFGLTFFYIKKKYMNPEPDLTLFTSVNPEYFIMESYVQDEWEIPRESIIQLGALGQGSFGMVYEGIVKKLKNHTEDTPCAIKTVNDHATNRERSNFLQEAIVMKEFNTSHVVRLLGVVSQGQPTLVVMELMKNGDLKAYLRQHRPNPEDDFGNLNESPPQPPTLNQILQMAIEIADGMAYLSAKKFVHRDLAARNCMVSEHLTVKIGDFGMTRDVYETDYYRKGTKGLLPVRWMSPESLKDGLFNSTSDVFSYGVVLWEMATLASQPYQGLSNDQVLRYVIDGGVMERPENCPDVLYNLMQRCWQHRPSARPTFIEIIQYLLENSTPKFHEPLYFHSPECQEAIEQIHVAEADDTTPLRMGEYDYRVEMDDSLESENRENLSVQEHHSPYSLGSAILMSSTPGISKQSMPTNQSNQSLFSQQQLKQLQKPMTSAAALAESGDVTTTTIISQPNIGPSLSDIMNETMPKKLTGSNTATTTKPNKTKKIQSSSLKRAVAETVQNVNSLVPSRLGRMDFIRNRFFNPTGRTNSNNVVNNNSNPINNSNNNNNINNNNGNGSTGGAPTTSLLLQLNANLPITTMTNFESETGMTMGTEIASSSGGRGFFSALTPSHTSKNPNYQILNESLNISTDEQNLPDSKNQDVSDEQHELRVLPLQSLEVGSGSSSHKLLNQTNKQCNDNKDNNFKESLRTNTVKVQRKPTPQKSPQQTRAPQSSLSLKTQSPSSRVQPHSSSSSLSSASSTSLALVLSKSTALQSHPTSKDNKKNSDSSHIKPHNIISTSKPAGDSETKTINKSFTKEQWLKNENQQQQKQQQPPNGFIGR